MTIVRPWMRNIELRLKQVLIGGSAPYIRIRKRDTLDESRSLRTAKEEKHMPPDVEDDKYTFETLNDGGTDVQYREVAL